MCHDVYWLLDGLEKMALISLPCVFHTYNNRDRYIKRLMADLVLPAAISIAADSSKMNTAATPKIIEATNHFFASGDFAVGSVPEKLSEQNATPKNERTPNPHRT